MTYLLHFGGTEIVFSATPKGRGAVKALVGYHHAKALAVHRRPRLRRRLPLAKRWQAKMLNWQRQTTAGIARTLRISDVSVRRWLTDAKEGRLA